MLSGACFRYPWRNPDQKPITDRYAFLELTPNPPDAGSNLFAEDDVSDYTVTIWGPNQPGGKIHSYDTNTKDGFVAAAEALAYFRRIHDGPIIDLDSRLEIVFHRGQRVDQLFTVRAILKCLGDDPVVLSGLEESDINALKGLAEQLQV